jgi:Cobalamin biosynthesis protein CobT (nicotinate-mononucleotide:5, 6-dimethylbenzimidazole phosphoribosyltransferase)
MKINSLILFAVFSLFLFSCDDGIKFDNPLDENNRTSDSNDTETETESDDDKTDTESTNDEENQNRDDSDSGDTMPDDADSNDDSGDSVTDENTPDNADSAPENDDDTDSESDEDEDEPVVVSVTTKCSNIPENAVYNTVDEITQTWNGEEWIPTNESYFSETPSTTECRFKCKSNYIWTGSQCALPTTPCDSNPCSGLANSNGFCTIAGSNYVCGCNTHYTWTGSVCKADEQTKPCTGKPENASWNTASQIKQTWDGEEWYPSTTAVYNTNASTTECRYKCSTNYSWNSSNSTCVLTTQQGTCSAKPANTVWNDNGKNGKFDQTWNGSTYTPESYTSTYSETAGICRFKCASAEYTWNGSSCTSAGSSLPECSSTSSTPCKDSSSDLIWSARASSTMTWSNAGTYCNNLTEGGYSDWHLPTISALRTLIRNCSGTVTGGSCGVTDSCLSRGCWTSDTCESCISDSAGKHSKFGETGGFWSSSVRSDNTVYAWRVRFSDGSVYAVSKAANVNVRCVRNAN